MKIGLSIAYLKKIKLFFDVSNVILFRFRRVFRQHNFAMPCRCHRYTAQSGACRVSRAAPAAYPLRRSLTTESERFPLPDTAHPAQSLYISVSGLEKLKRMLFSGFMRMLSTPISVVPILVCILSRLYGLKPHFSCTLFDRLLKS